RRGNIVLEPAWQRLEERMHNTNGGVALIDVINQDTDAGEVKHRRKVAPTHNHRLVNRPVVLRPPPDSRVSAAFFQRTAYLLLDFCQSTVTGRRTVCNHADNLVIFLWVQDGKS